ncbi:MAG: hypothetical protein ACYDBY_20875 [Thermoanaerobaculia bacterium]
MRRPRAHLAFVGCALLLLRAGPSLAAERPLLVGASIGYDSPMEGERTFVGEVLARWDLSPSTVLEAAVSHRKATYERSGGASGEAYTLTQEPLLLGARQVLNPGRPVRLLLGAGLHASQTRLSYRSYVHYYPGPDGSSTQSGSTSKIVVGAYAGLDAEIRLGPSMCLLSGLRYVYNPVSIPVRTSSSPNYFRLFVGGGARL